MSSSAYAPPANPPPPKVPDGWVTCWDNNYKRFYFVNLATKQSQWEVPTDPDQTPAKLEDPPVNEPPP